MSTDQDSQSALGAWTEQELQRTHRESHGAGSDHDIDANTRFLRGVARLVRTRETIDEKRADSRELSVFLLAPEAGTKEGLSREPMLDNGLTAIAGFLWFVGPVVVCGWRKELVAKDDDGVFRAVTDDLGYGNVPAVIVDPRPSRTSVRYYPSGLSDVDNWDDVRIDFSDLNFQQVCEVIDRVHKDYLVTPDAQPQGNRLWTNAKKHWPQSDAEHRVLAILKAAFLGKFPTCSVQHESTGTAGRVDLRLDEINPLDRANWIHLVLLELKVLRSYGATGHKYSETDNKEWVETGVKQAHEYRKEHGHREAALCCFDMRKEDGGTECFDAVAELASEKQIALRRWYLYSSSKRFRNARTPRPSTSA